MTTILKRLVDFVTLIMIRQCGSLQIPPLAHQHFFEEEERDTAVYAYGPYENLEHHPEDVLVVKFLQDNGLKIFASWQGVSVTLESNMPEMGWDREHGEFGLGGDWWKMK